MMAQAPQTKGAFLPTEIVITILSFASDEDAVNENWQSTLLSCCLVCQQWYAAAIPFLYAKPVISARNYDSFAGTLDVRGKARHNIQEPLGSFVKHLDLGGLAHSGSKSVTARLLRACKEGLEVFVAPASTFSWVTPKELYTLLETRPFIYIIGQSNKASYFLCNEIFSLQLSMYFFLLEKGPTQEQLLIIEVGLLV